MTKRRLHFSLLVPNENASRGIITRLKAQLAPFSLARQDAPPVFTQGGANLDTPQIVGQILFEKEADAIIFRNNVRDEMLTGRSHAIVASGSRISLHWCSHDDPIVTLCVEDEIFVK